MSVSLFIENSTNLCPIKCANVLITLFFPLQPPPTCTMPGKYFIKCCQIIYFILPYNEEKKLLCKLTKILHNFSSPLYIHTLHTTQLCCTLLLELLYSLLSYILPSTNYNSTHHSTLVSSLLLTDTLVYSITQLLVCLPKLSSTFYLHTS